LLGPGQEPFLVEFYFAELHFSVEVAVASDTLVAHADHIKVVLTSQSLDLLFEYIRDHCARVLVPQVVFLQEGPLVGVNDVHGVPVVEHTEHHCAFVHVHEHQVLLDQPSLEGQQFALQRLELVVLHALDADAHFSRDSHCHRVKGIHGQRVHRLVG